MPYGLERRGEKKGTTQFCNRILIQYRYQGSDVAILRLRPMIGDRDFHHQQQANQICTFTIARAKANLSASDRPGQWGHPVRWTTIKQTKFGTGIITCRRPDADWAIRKTYSPGLTTTLQPGATPTLEARVGWSDSNSPPPPDFEQAVQAQQRAIILDYLTSSQNPSSNIWRQLQAGDQFIVYRVNCRNCHCWLSLVQ